MNNIEQQRPGGRFNLWLCVVGLGSSKQKTSIAREVGGRKQMCPFFLPLLRAKIGDGCFVGNCGVAVVSQRLTPHNFRCPKSPFSLRLLSLRGWRAGERPSMWIKLKHPMNVGVVQRKQRCVATPLDALGLRSYPPCFLQRFFPLLHRLRGGLLHRRLLPRFPPSSSPLRSLGRKE